jgi:hypothetical protein
MHWKSNSEQFSYKSQSYTFLNFGTHFIVMYVCLFIFLQRFDAKNILIIWQIFEKLFFRNRPLKYLQVSHCEKVSTDRGCLTLCVKRFVSVKRDLWLRKNCT